MLPLSWISKTEERIKMKKNIIMFVLMTLLVVIALSVSGCGGSWSSPPFSNRDIDAMDTDGVTLGIYRH